MIEFKYDVISKNERAENTYPNEGVAFNARGKKTIVRVEGKILHLQTA